jgi:arylsulfatase A-like enzyme/Flp pilus assembly protein TadD
MLSHTYRLVKDTLRGSANPVFQADSRLAVRRTVRLIMLVCIATSVGASSNSAISETQFSPVHPNLILITIDTMRPDRLGVYGNRENLTPRMDGLASDGVVFSHAIAQVPLTLPSHTTILTGTYPTWHGVEDLSSPGLGRDVPTLAEILKGHGYDTAAFVSSFVLNSMWGLNRGFDYYDDWIAAETSDSPHQRLERRAQETIDHSLDWLRGHLSGTFFLWIHLYDPHAPYDPPEPFKSHYRAQPYDGEIAYTDSQLGRLVDFLKDHKLYSSSVILLTSDHGEGLGEHQEQQHGFFVYNSTVHVPLILKPVGSIPLVNRVSSVVSLVDIAPTLLHMCGCSEGESTNFQGRELLPPNQNDAADRGTGYAESLYPRLFGWHSLHSAQNERYQFIEGARPELYDLTEDPEELRNIVDNNPAVAAALRRELSSVLSRYRSTLQRGAKPILDIESSRKLQALGYIGGSPTSKLRTEPAGAPDPKENIAVYNKILKATELTEDREFRQSDVVLQALSVKNPTLFLLPYLRGENMYASGAFLDSMPYYRRALQLNPQFTLAAMGLGHAAYLAGDNTEAIRAYRLALDLNPENFLIRLALARTYVRLNRLPEAADEQQRVIRDNPNARQAYTDYGSTLVLMKQFAVALPILLKATENGEATGETFNLLGNVYLHTGTVSDAIKAYKRAIDIDPRYGPAYINLALVYYKLQDQTNFRSYYEKGCHLDQKLCRSLDPKIH